jgi:hypothetical protein
LTERVRALDRANPLLGVLNGDSGVEAQKRLTSLLVDMQTLAAMCADQKTHMREELLDGSTHHFLTDEGLDLFLANEKKSLTILQRVNFQLRKSRWSLLLQIFNGPELNRIWEFHEDPNLQNLEYSIYFLLDYYLPAEELDRFRRCDECGRWFFAVTAHQRYCSEKCRSRHISHSAEFKEKRRRYMKRYRRDEKQRDLAARTLPVRLKGR